MVRPWRSYETIIKSGYVVVCAMANVLVNCAKLNMNKICINVQPFQVNRCVRCLATSSLALAAKKSGGPIIDFPDMGPPIPEYQARVDETLEQKKARLFYQSR